MHVLPKGFRRAGLWHFTQQRHSHPVTNSIAAPGLCANADIHVYAKIVFRLALPRRI